MDVHPARLEDEGSSSPGPASPSRWGEKLGREFVISVEIVPPADGTCDHLIQKIARSLNHLPIDALNLADSPMACPRMSPFLFAGLVRVATQEHFEIIPHITVRDRNRVALQGLVWGAVAAGIRTVLIVSGDPVQYSRDAQTRLVADLSVTDMVRVARAAGLRAGVVMDSRPSQRAIELRKLEKKLEAGAQFVITQPLYDVGDVEHLARDTEAFGIPVLLGILPLVSRRHAGFLNDRVPGISVPEHVLDALEAAGEKAGEVGLAVAKTMLEKARQCLAGACIMPPFERFHLVAELLDRLQTKAGEGDDS